VKFQQFQRSLFVALLVFCGALTSAAGHFGQSAEQAPAARPHAYHDQPSPEPLPDTLNPSQFGGDRVAFTVYFLAARIKQTLFQVPCYCPCDRRQGHTSLLDCYRDRHGVACPTCQKELLFCYRANRKGQSPAEIRAAIAQGKAWKIDITKTVDRMYGRLFRSQE
jgi:hypothetical protein